MSSVNEAAVEDVEINTIKIVATQAIEEAVLVKHTDAASAEVWNVSEIGRADLRYQEWLYMED
eukprot:snap_masked-scaffold_9-processed-gene-5.25-mRNA-1 protein AED:1.00 eAED:1.00 QI:0/0/0/0/1/1/2/0/62